LAQDQKIQTLLRDELLAFGGEPTFDDFVNPETLPYLDAVTKEW
jgi:hypothetical protein